MIFLNFENYFPTETYNSLESRKAFLSKVEKTRCTSILINDMAKGLFKYKNFDRFWLKPSLGINKKTGFSPFLLNFVNHIRKNYHSFNRTFSF